MKALKDFFYDKNDIIVVLIILALAALVIYSRIDSITKYPEVLAEQVAKTATEESITAQAADNSTGETTIEIIIEDSDTVETVTQKLFNAGVISSTEDFSRLISEQGKTESLLTGTFQIPSDSTDEEILNIIAN